MRIWAAEVNMKKLTMIITPGEETSSILQLASFADALVVNIFPMPERPNDGKPVTP